MTIRFFGSFFGPLFAKETPAPIPQSEVMPLKSYKQQCEEHLLNCTHLLNHFHPVYFTKCGFYYQVIDECTCIEVDINAGSRGIHKGSTPAASAYFQMVSYQLLKQNGYEEITAEEFHYHFTKTQNEINLTVNTALQRK